MDVGSINARLGQAASAGSRALDRVCEDLAAELIDANLEPPFQIPSADFTDARLICADRYWRRRFLREPTVEVAARCARWLYDHAEPPVRPDIIERWSLGYAFITRDSVESRDDLTGATRRILETYPDSADIYFFATLFHAGKLRANFWFDELAWFLESSLLAVAAGEHREDPLFTALRAYAALGSRSIPTSTALDLLERAWSAPRSRAVVDVCLNALAAAPPFPDRGGQLHRRAADAVAAFPDDHLFRFRLACGQRLCGDYADALASIDTALRLLPAIGTRISHNLLQEQYLRERAGIQQRQELAASIAPQQTRASEQDSPQQDRAHTLAVRSLELLVVFAVAIVFVVSALRVTLTGTLSFRDRALLLTILDAGLLLFAFLILAGIWTLAGRRKRPPTPHLGR
ncbi:MULTISPECIES: hypothetical protein [Frankia]|uniref:Uncharacterized protein n=1 Tax=Frankia alni (strain DSM 45986 / CECT 9034 / ACN14a) TaxID=326424 RepID=Q0RM70_FRAAA|nr:MULTISPECIES: hypothetical protein [Frankia]CAJ61382.1 hypothetical protein FRAAL2738 [Frankia alni ACN14a]